MRTRTSTTAALAIRVGAATLFVAPAGGQAHSLTAIGHVTQLTATGVFSGLGIRLGDPYKMTLTFERGFAAATFGRTSGGVSIPIEGFGDTTVPPDLSFPEDRAGLELGAVTTSLPADYSLGGRIPEFTAPNDAGALWQMMLIDKSSDAFVPSLDQGRIAMRDIDPAPGELYQFGFSIRANNQSRLNLGPREYSDRPGTTMVLNGGAPDPDSWALNVTGAAGTGVMARARREGLAHAA